MRCKASLMGYYIPWIRVRWIWINHKILLGLPRRESSFSLLLVLCHCIRLYLSVGDWAHSKETNCRDMFVRAVQIIIEGTYRSSRYICKLNPYKKRFQSVWQILHMVSWTSYKIIRVPDCVRDITEGVGQFHSNRELICALWGRYRYGVHDSWPSCCNLNTEVDWEIESFWIRGSYSHGL